MSQDVGRADPRKSRETRYGW